MCNTRISFFLSYLFTQCHSSNTRISINDVCIYFVLIFRFFCARETLHTVQLIVQEKKFSCVGTIFLHILECVPVMHSENQFQFSVCKQKNTHTHILHFMGFTSELLTAQLYPIQIQRFRRREDNIFCFSSLLKTLCVRRDDLYCSTSDE